MLPWESYLQETIPYAPVCNVTPDPDTRVKEKKKKQQQKTKRRKAACFHPKRVRALSYLEKERVFFFFFFFYVWLHSSRVHQTRAPGSEGSLAFPELFNELSLRSSSAAKLM